MFAPLTRQRTEPTHTVWRERRSSRSPDNTPNPPTHSLTREAVCVMCVKLPALILQFAEVQIIAKFYANFTLESAFPALILQFAGVQILR